jgi:Tol biopolymer transport system component
MYLLKYKIACRYIEKNRYDDALKILYQLVSKQRPEIYVLIAEILLRKGLVNEAHNYLKQLLVLDNWYKKDVVENILKITNWKMLANNKNFCREPIFSPDGEKILFVAATRDTNNDGKINVSDRGGIFVVNRNGSGLKCLVPDEYYNASPKFSPDNRYVIFLSARRDTNNDKIIDNKDDRGMYLLDTVTGEEKLLVEDFRKPKHPSFSPDGKKVLFTCWQTPDSCSGVYEIDIKTLEIKTLVREFFENTFPSYSPDGSKIVFSSWRDSYFTYGSAMGKSVICVKDLYSMEEIQITSGKYIDSFPVFSNDSQYIAYLSKRRDTNGDGVINSLDNDVICLYDLNKKKEFVIRSDEFYNKYLNFSSDNKSIVFLTCGHKKDVGSKNFFEFKGIYKCNLKGKNFSQIVSEKYYGCASPSTSPKNNEVVYTAFRKDTMRGLYLAYINNFPSEEEMREIIRKNLL